MGIIDKRSLSIYEVSTSRLTCIWSCVDIEAKLTVPFGGFFALKISDATSITSLLAAPRNLASGCLHKASCCKNKHRVLYGFGSVETVDALTFVRDETVLNRRPFQHLAARCMSSR